MRPPRKTVSLLLVFAMGLLAACGPAPRPMPGPGAPLRVTVFATNHHLAPGHPLMPLLAANAPGIAALSPLWYKVAANGSVTDTSVAATKTWAAAHHIALTPLVINGGGGSAFLMNAAARARAVSNLAAILKSQPYAGLNIDFELLKTAARSGLTSFETGLYAQAKAMGKTITVDLIPAHSRRGLHYAYDFAALAKNSTDVVLMTYDAHDNTSKPGPIAPLAWVQQDVREALSAGVPKDKLVVGIADYGYDWAGSTKGHTVGLKQAEALLAKEHATLKRNRNGSPHFTYTKGGTRHIVWYEDSASVVHKIAYARQLGVKGLALWRAGYETAAYWKAVRAAAGTAAGGGAPAITPSAAPSAPSSGGGSGTAAGGAGGQGSSGSSASSPASTPASSSSSGSTAASSGTSRSGAAGGSAGSSSAVG